MSLKQPVQYPVKYYSHLDAGAPQLANADGVIKTILKACLVTGYGTKAGAGWTALFDDAFRIVLRRPLRTGNPPDIKIENGVINGVASHRIVSQNNPTGLDDTVELAAVNLLARDTQSTNKWHLVVSDFGLLFAYGMAENGNSTYKALSMLYIGSLVGLVNDVTGMVASYHKATKLNGQHAPWSHAFASVDTPLKDLWTNQDYPTKSYYQVSGLERQFNNDCVAQKILIGDNGASLPFYTSIASSYTDLTASEINIDGRPMLRIVNRMGQDYDSRPYYIPIDYWEL